MSIYTALVKTARRLLAKYGQTLTFTRMGAGSVLDPDTLQYTEVPDTVFSDKGVVFAYSNGVTSMENTIIQRDDQQVFWQGSTAPIPTDKMTTEAGDVYNVINVKPLQPSGVNVLYEIQVRK